MSRPLLLCGNALTEAVARGNFSAVRGCLAQGRHPDDEDAVDEVGCSPLQRAIADTQDQGDDLVRLLLAAGADPNGSAYCEGTPLMTAALYGDVGVIRLLVESGANTGACEPMEIADREGHIDAVLALCALGAPRRHWPAWVREDEARDYLAAWESVGA